MTLALNSIINGPRSEVLILFGAKQNGLIADFQLERLIFPMFLHANLIHLAFNMYAFLQVGKFLEYFMGAYSLLGVYIISGLMGNIFSFALISSVSQHSLLFGSHNVHAILSVGASGSLFGILLCLFVLQKYQAKLAKETGQEEPSTNLGALIVVNGFITFLIPNIDWACHLGGAVAGALLGLAFCLNHARIRKHYLAVKFLSFSQKCLKTPFYKHENFPISICVLIALLGLTPIFFIKPTEVILGRGLLAVAKDNIESRNLNLLSNFNSMLIKENASTNPEKLLAAAISMHKNGNFHAAVMLYLVLQEYINQKIGSPEFLSEQTKILISTALEYANGKLYLPEHFPNIFDPIKTTVNLCSEPAEVFRNLGFFVLGGALFECAYSLEPRNLKLAASTVELYWRASNVKMMELFLEYFDENKKR